MQFALLIFCLLTIVGAFSAWRKSPLYSLKTTLKLAGGFLLIAAVVADASLAIVSGPLSRSPGVEGVPISEEPALFPENHPQAGGWFSADRRRCCRRIACDREWPAESLAGCGGDCGVPGHPGARIA